MNETTPSMSKTASIPWREAVGLIRRDETSRPATAMALLAGSAYALLAGLWMASWIVFRAPPDLGIVGYVGVRQYPIQQDTMWYVLALAGIPASGLLVWMLGIRLAAACCRGDRRLLSRLFYRHAGCSLLLLLGWFMAVGMGRLSAAAVAAPPVLTVIAWAALWRSQGCAGPAGRGYEPLRA